MESIFQLIDRWNSSRLELFRISRPDKDQRFFGVMRFFYESNDKYHSKCVRVSSDMTVKSLLPSLWSKFSVLTRGVRVRDVRLYERCGSKDKLLGPEERPLLIQLCWCQDDKEGVFVLRASSKDCCPVNDTPCVNSCIDSNGNLCLSRYYDQDQHNSSSRLTNSLLSRTISNPESLMKLRRKATLELKLQQIFRSGNINGGGTLKIYGDSLNPMIPYKSLLLSVDDTASYVVREILTKYGLEDQDPNDFCLVKVTSGGVHGLDKVSTSPDFEEILHKNDSPLKSLLGSIQDPSFIKFKVIKCPPHLRKRRKGPMKSPEKSRVNVPKPVDNVGPKKVCSMEPHRIFKSKYDSSRVAGGYIDSGFESQQSCTTRYPSEETLPIYDPVNNNNNNNNNIYYSPPFISNQPEPGSRKTGVTTDLDLRPLPSYEESVQRASRFMKTSVPAPPAHEQILSPFRGSLDSFSLSSDCMEDISYNVDSTGDNSNNVSDLRQMNRTSQGQTDLGLVADLDSQLSRHLPVQITYFKSKEDLLLDSLILDPKGSQAKFKLSLAYVLHLMVVDIIRLTCINKTSRIDQELIIGNFIEKVTAKIRQSIMQNRTKISMQTFWLANCTEFLHLLKNNPLLYQLNKDHFQRFYELFADNTQCCFQYISYCFKEDVVNTLPVLLAEQADDDEDRDGLPLSKKALEPRVMSDLVRTLSSCMSVLKQCLVNPALVIQIMSRIFHLINSWIFNKFLDEPALISRSWALLVASRVDRIRRWSATQDLVLAADCYLQRCIQMCQLIIIQKTDVEVLYNDSVDLVQINSVQLRYFLENYRSEEDEPQVPQIWIDFVCSGVMQVADKIFEEENVEVVLKEEEDLNLPLLLPDDGYHVDSLFGGIPDGFLDYLNELHREWCFYKVSHQNIHFDWLCNKSPRNEVHTNDDHTTLIREQCDPDPSPIEVVDRISGQTRSRHQLKLSDFKGNINSLQSDREVDPGKVSRFFQVDHNSQERLVETKDPRSLGIQDHTSTYASSFSTTEEVDPVDADEEEDEEETLPRIREVRCLVERRTQEDMKCQAQLQALVGDLDHTYDRKLKDMMEQYERGRSEDLFLLNYRRMRLEERREEAFDRYRKNKESDSSSQRNMHRMLSSETDTKSFFPLSYTFPGYGSHPPQTFVSTSLAIGNNLNYPPKTKPKPRPSNLLLRRRSQSVSTVRQESMDLTGLNDLRPRSSSTDKFYSKSSDCMENLTFQEKLDMFEYGMFSSCH